MLGIYVLSNSPGVSTKGLIESILKDNMSEEDTYVVSGDAVREDHMHITGLHGNDFLHSNLSYCAASEHFNAKVQLDHRKFQGMDILGEGDSETSETKLTAAISSVIEHDNRGSDLNFTEQMAEAISGVNEDLRATTVIKGSQDDNKPIHTNICLVHKGDKEPIEIGYLYYGGIHAVIWGHNQSTCDMISRIGDERWCFYHPMTQLIDDVWVLHTMFLRDKFPKWRSLFKGNGGNVLIISSVERYIKRNKVSLTKVGTYESEVEHEGGIGQG